MAFLLIIGFALLIFVINDMFKEDNGYSRYREVTEEDISPMTEMLMFEDFMEDGDLDLF